MRILLYEFATGGGLMGLPDVSQFQTLAREGAAMITAVAADFAALAQCHVQVLRDARLESLAFPGCEIVNVTAAGEDERLLEPLSSMADWILLIAPETDGVLWCYCRQVLTAGGRLLGPSLEFIELASDKHRTAERLTERGVPVPQGPCLAPGQTLPADFTYPAVLKPRDGCGSHRVQLVADREAACQVGKVQAASRLEEFAPGLAASVALLCGPGIVYPLPSCQQLLGGVRRFEYQGGICPLPDKLAQRAQALAMQAVAAMPAATGYLGIDLVLGPAADGSQDRVIEINPRLTTSYVGLRATCRENLAEAMLEAAGGRSPELSFRPAPIRFTAGGEVISV